MLNASLNGSILTAGDDKFPVSVLASWNENDPLTFHLSFLPEGHSDSVDWVFGRALLLEALGNPGQGVGDGDVVLSMKSNGMMHITVDSPEGTAVVEMPSHVLASMAAESVRMVEPGSDAEAAVYDAQFCAEIMDILDGTL